MTDETKELVCALREYVRLYSIPFCWWRPIDGTEILMDEAAKLIENLCAVLESEGRQYGRDAFETIVAEGVKLEADRDAWKRRAEAAERELFGICWCCANAVPLEITPSSISPESHILYTCDEIKKHGVIAGNGQRKCERWKWRGPCAENGVR